MEYAVDEHYVDGRTVTLNDLYLEHSALESRFLGQLLALRRLTHSAEVVDQVGQAFAGDGRRRHKTERVLRGLVVPVESNVKALLVEGKDRLLKLSLEVIDSVLLLRFEGVARVFVSLRGPLIQAIDLV